VDFDHPRLQRDPPGLVGPEGRRELRRELLPRLRWCLWKQGERQIVNLPFDDAGQRRGAQLRTVGHIGTLRPYAPTRILLGFHSPLRVAVPSLISAGFASTMVSNLRSDPQSRPQSLDR